MYPIAAAARCLLLCFCLICRFARTRTHCDDPGVGFPLPLMRILVRVVPLAFLCCAAICLGIPSSLCDIPRN